ncbi:hypothetical protein PR202_ga15122 [Eleusine coracana subsp. coracana]|uniref:L-ascorbate oxidase n=1 Tax=Eleusine coracana subsp. coracana TaxID=191504 RepID=A0AAV5CI63_ELECO|nr:hypothetical protein PR202_ga15122 [Eleusine coracana subsp. coracana]
MRLPLLVAVCCTVWAFVVLPHCAEAKARHFKWEVSNMFWSPDGEEKVLIGINGQFPPGPTIRARAGDTIHVELKNALHTEGVVIHWHGIRQRAAGLYGSLIVDVAEGEEEPFKYDGELNLLLSDWYHESIHTQMVALSSKPFRWIGEPQSVFVMWHGEDAHHDRIEFVAAWILSLLINGRGQFNCSLAAAHTPGTKQCVTVNRQCAPVVLPVQPNKTYRLRVASTTSLASLNLAVGNHKLTVVEADGNYVDPFVVDDIDIYSGDSYSVLLTTDQDPSSNYWVSVGVRGRQPKTAPALAVLNYRPNPASKLPSMAPPVTPAWNDYAHSKAFTYRIRAREGTTPPPANADRRIELLNTQNRMDGHIKWSINNSTLTAARPAETFSRGYDVTRPPPNPNTTVGGNVYVLRHNDTVDVVLQNANALAHNVSEVHPWHLHGHDFWVLGYGEGHYDHGRDAKTLNRVNPPLRNTAVIFPYGWTVLRFVADNPGVWAFHCHIEPHLHMGMGVIFAEAIERVGKVPREAVSCGATANALMNGAHL